MKLLVTGRNGQVGHELAVLFKDEDLVALDRSALDLSDSRKIGQVLRETRPDVIINAAAYTAVDRAESEPELAMAVNGVAPGVLAEEARRLGALLVHYSTDYVFSGEKKDPYTEQDPTGPLNVYGGTKLEGERRIIASGCRHLIFRTSWVYAPRGRNFLLTIRKAAGEKPELRVVADQLGAPSSAAAIAAATAQALRKPDAQGLYHMTAAGRTSWHGFAEAIVEAAGAAVPVIPVSSGEFAAKAKRPRNSVLDNSRLQRELGVALDDWRSELRNVLARLAR